MVEWSCKKQRINKRGPYVLVEWSCTNKRNKSMKALVRFNGCLQKERTKKHIFWSDCRGQKKKKKEKPIRTLNFGRMVVH